MNQIQELCSTPDQLLAFLRGHLSYHQENDLQTHLDDCESCRLRLESTAADADAWKEAEHMLGSTTLQDFDGDSHLDSNSATPQIQHVLDSLLPTDDPDSLGRIGGYEVTGVVGAGGMGVVLKAHERALDRIVAIKVMAPHLAASGSARKRFAREAKAAAAVIHPNVIAIHGVSNDGSLPYLVMPFIGGDSLQRRLNHDGPLPTIEVLRVGSQIAAGLAAAHGQGLVHRDIKPANILMDNGVERVSITDFGLARAVDDASMTRTGVIAGTPQFMSPEQARGLSIDHRSDLFSLGSVLYTMCTGRAPFRAETSYGVLRRITDDEPKPIREINSDIPAWLCRIIDKLMSKQADDRFDSADQVAQLLEDCLAHVQQPTTALLPESLRTKNADTFLTKIVGRLGFSATSTAKWGRSDASASTPISAGIRFPPIRKIIAGAAFASFLAFAGVMIVLEMGKGTLTINSEVDDIPIRIVQGNEVVKELTVHQKAQSIQIAAGRYEVEFGGKFDSALIANGSVVLKRGETEVVSIVRAANSENELSDIDDILIQNYNVEDLIENNANMTASQQLDKLAELLSETIAVDSWDGKELTITPYPTNASLVVRQTASRHNEIAELLKSLRTISTRSATEQVINALVTVEYSGVSRKATIRSTSIGWVVDDEGHILFLSPGATDSEDIEVRYANGFRSSAKSLETIGHFTLLQAENTNGAQPIPLNSKQSFKDGESALAVLNATDVVHGNVTNSRGTVVISKGPGWTVDPPIRFPNVIRTDFEADDATLYGAPLLTQHGDVAGMLMHYAPVGMFAIPLAEIQVTCRQFSALKTGRQNKTPVTRFRELYGIELVENLASSGANAGMRVVNIAEQRKLRVHHLRVGDVLMSANTELLKDSSAGNGFPEPVDTHLSLRSAADFGKFVESLPLCFNDPIQIEGVRRAKTGIDHMTFELPNPWLGAQTPDQVDLLREAEAKINEKLIQLPQEKVNQLYLDMKAAKDTGSAKYDQLKPKYDSAHQRRTRLSDLYQTIASKIEEADLDIDLDDREVHAVFSASDGRVIEVLVDTNEQVEQGQALLRFSIDDAGDTDESSVVTAPVIGTILTENLEKKLAGRRVQAGQVLLEIAGRAPQSDSPEEKDATAKEDGGATTPQVALVMLMHPAELRNGNTIQRAAATKVMKLLSDKDYCGILRYGPTGNSWLWGDSNRLQQIGDHRSDWLGTIAASTCGDTPLFDPALRMALDGLKQTDTRRKQLVIFTDGDPTFSDTTLIDNFRDAKIRVSVIHVDIHRIKEVPWLKKLATETGGRYHYVVTTQAAAVERLFQREVRSLQVDSFVGLRKIAVAFHDFNDKHGKFPTSAGTRLEGNQRGIEHPFSWRVAILPYIGEQELFDEYRFNEPWNSIRNLALLNRMPAIYRSPNATSDQPFGNTNVLGFATKSGALGVADGETMASFTDGMSNTILVVESAHSVPWTKPEDLSDPKVKPFANQPLRFAMADGSVGEMDRIDEVELAKMITRNGGEQRSTKD